jgi:exodeoxyribonuclease V alpha subunit
MWIEEQASEALEPIDRHFGHLLGRLDGGAPLVARAAALTSRAVREGHSCLDVAAAAAAEAAAPADWLQGLRASAAVGAPGEWRPLILDAAGRLYLYRYWAYEQALARAIRARAPLARVDEGALRAQLDVLFGTEGTDWQKIAAATACLRRFCVVTGGPGTGKTHTVVRILAALLGQAGARPPNVALAAPTGKAAARLQEAIRAAKHSLPVEPDVRAAIPESASTLHRLLGVRPNSVHFRHGPDNPLPLDVLVVDEASMVDLALMAKLVGALPAHARLILLGDRDQLASVETGSVLSDICEAGGGGFSPAFARRLEVLTGAPVPAAEAAAPPLADALVHLQHSRRFSGQGGIGRLAAFVNQGQATEALELLRSGGEGELAWQSPGAGLGQALAKASVAGYGAYLQAIGSAEPGAVFALFNAFRVLCAHRSGPSGVEALNRSIRAALIEAGLLRGEGVWYPGRPVMIGRNDYDLHLYNGDVGLCLPGPDGLRVVFQSVDEGLRQFHPGRLPVHEDVFAMTVHKTQGSEFERVMLVLPAEESRVLNRKLLYTAITRARSGVLIWGSETVFRRSVATPALRGSGLVDALRQ